MLKLKMKLKINLRIYNITIKSSYHIFMIRKVSMMMNIKMEINHFILRLFTMVRNGILSYL